MKTQLLLKVKEYIDSKVNSLTNDIANLKLKHGVDGKDGRDGRDGKDGKDGKNGKDGNNGKDGLKGVKGKDGRDGEDGDDGVSVVDAKVDFDNHLVLTLSDDSEIDAGSLESLIKPSAVMHSISTVGGGTAKRTWVDYFLNYTAEPVSLGVIDGGEQFRYEMLDGTYYRFVPNPYVPTNDAFYSDSNYSQFVVARGGGAAVFPVLATVDGGTAETVTFNETLDGGTAPTTVFNDTTDGGVA